MALDDIKQHIQTKADEAVAEVEKASAERLESLKTEWEGKVAEEKDRVLNEINRKAESKLAQAKFKIRERVNAEKLLAKQAQIDSVYEKALQSLSEMSDKDYANVLEKLLEPVKNEEGVLATSSNRLAALKDAAKKVGCKAEVTDEEIDTIGGFVFASERIDLDSTFETLMKQIKEDSLIEVHKTLFNE